MEKYDIYKAAQTSGGPCPICNWKDGDGVRTCFYSSELGIVKHQNNEEGILVSMTEAQKHLYRLRQELVYINADLREKQIKLVAYSHHLYVEKQRREYPDRPPTIDKAGNPVSEEQWVAIYRKQAEEKALATDPRFEGWMHEYWWVPVNSLVTYGTAPENLLGPVEEHQYTSQTLRLTAYMTHVYEPHSCGKGHRYDIAPYHLGCTGCATEVKLWEHGVDYDMG